MSDNEAAEPGTEHETSGPQSPDAVPGLDEPADDGLPLDDEAADQLAGVTKVFQYFVGPVDARNSMFGHSGGNFAGEPARRQRRLADTGRLTEDDLAEALTGYVRPASYDEALGILTKHQVVELWGSAGLGKRAGAISLLREVMDGPVVLLRPTLSLKELTQWGYRSGHGYVLPGRLTDDTAIEEIEALWRQIRTTVRDCKAHLVVTSALRPPGSPWRVVWERPAPGRLLLAGLGAAEVPDEHIEEVLAQVPADFRPQDLREAAHQLAAGSGPTAALEQFSLAASAAVHEWFEAGQEPDEILTVTALAFTEGTGVREYEHGLAELRLRMAESVPGLVPTVTGLGPEAAAVPVLPENRTARAKSDGLTRAMRISDGLRKRTVIVFREPVYRERVLTELYERYDIRFWEGLSSWLAGRVRARTDTDPQLQMSVAAGLAELARLDVQEVEVSYLHPWATGQLGVAGRQTAVFTLWLMCLLDDALAPVALNAAEDWALSGSQGRRWAAAIAFTGELGVRYPHSATSRLWNLIDTDPRLRIGARTALASLFAALAAASRASAGVILRLLAQKLPDRPRQPSEVLLATVLEVIAVPADRGDGLAIMSHLADCPADFDRVGRLWSAVLCHRPLRRRALTALMHALEGLAEGATEGRMQAERLGRALANALPDRELPGFHREFAWIVDKPGGPSRSAELIDVLLAAVWPTDGRPVTEVVR